MPVNRRYCRYRRRSINHPRSLLCRMYNILHTHTRAYYIVFYGNVIKKLPGHVWWWWWWWWRLLRHCSPLRHRRLVAAVLVLSKLLALSHTYKIIILYKMRLVYMLQPSIGFRSSRHLLLFLRNDSCLLYIYICMCVCIIRVY